MKIIKKIISVMLICLMVMAVPAFTGIDFKRLLHNCDHHGHNCHHHHSSHRHVHAASSGETEIRTVYHLDLGFQQAWNLNGEWGTHTHPTHGTVEVKPGATITVM